MKNYIYLIVFFVFVGCNNENPTDDGTFGGKFKIDQLNGTLYYSDIPEWLAVKILEIEAENANDIPIIKISIHKCEWKGRSAYFIHEPWKSSLNDPFYENGKVVTFSSIDEMSDFFNTSENWLLIYEFGKGEQHFEGLHFN